MKNYLLSLLSLLILSSRPISSQPLPLDQWTCITVDSTRSAIGSLSFTWLRAFGLDFGDVNGDGFQDIISGRYIHLSPGGDMTGAWSRLDFNRDLDAFMCLNVDDDEFADVLAMQFPDVVWLEALDKSGTTWNSATVAYVKPTDHQNGQGYAAAQILPGGKPEILLACGDGTHYLRIPANPRGGLWPDTHIAADPQVMAEGIGVGDLDADGHPDIVVGIELGGGSFQLKWYKNPADSSGNWPGHILSANTNTPDRIVVADLNGDNRLDVAVAEERWPGLEPNAGFYWFEQPADVFSGDWPKHQLLTTFSVNNLDAGDIDRDGDIDLVTNEHKGQQHPLFLFENDGRGNFTQHVLDRGKEMHLGARLFDLDGDGDLDLTGPGWDAPNFMHLWRNDAVKK